MVSRRVLVGATSIVFSVAAILLTVGGMPGSIAGLRAEVVTSKADIGIPGISKIYDARLVNRGIWPVRVSYCDFISDNSTRGKMIGYSVERWDSMARKWTTIVDVHGADFCKPYPLGIVEARLTSTLLWPGQSLSTGEEATAARDAFNVGDRARFVVFRGTSEDSTSAVATPDFVIDEHRQTDVPLRVLH